MLQQILTLFPALPHRVGFFREGGHRGSVEPRHLHHQRAVRHQARDRERDQDGQEDRRVRGHAAGQGEPLQEDRRAQEGLQRHRK